MAETTRANYLIVIGFKDESDAPLVRTDRFMVYNALNSKHALTSVFSTGADHVPWDAEVSHITVVKDDSTSRVVKL